MELRFFLIASLCALSACGRPRYDMKDQARVAPVGESQKNLPVPAPASAGGTPVCGAKSLVESGVAAYGVDAFAKKLSRRQVRGSSVKELFDPKLGRVLKTGLRYPDISVTPRDCSRGYPAPETPALATESGRIVSQYLALSFQGFVAVNPESAGYYQFASLADDGAVIEVFVSGKWQTLVDNDGFHSVRLKCSEVIVQLDGTGVMPFRVYYYQGPRLHLANMMLWRKVTGFNASRVDAACGREGQRLFFDPKTSAPKAPFTEFLARGWSVVPTTSLVVPSKEGAQHPCFGPTVHP